MSTARISTRRPMQVTRAVLPTRSGGHAPSVASWITTSSGRRSSVATTTRTHAPAHQSAGPRSATWPPPCSKTVPANAPTGIGSSAEGTSRRIRSAGSPSPRSTATTRSAVPTSAGSATGAPPGMAPAGPSASEAVTVDEKRRARSDRSAESGAIRPRARATTPTMSRTNSTAPNTRFRRPTCNERTMAASSRRSERERGPKASLRSPPLSSVAQRVTVSSGNRRARVAKASSSSGPKSSSRSFSRRSSTGSLRWTNFRSPDRATRKARICRSASSSLHRPPVCAGRSATGEVVESLSRKKPVRRSLRSSETSVPGSTNLRSGAVAGSTRSPRSVATSSSMGSSGAGTSPRLRNLTLPLRAPVPEAHDVPHTVHRPIDPPVEDRSLPMLRPRHLAPALSVALALLLAAGACTLDADTTQDQTGLTVATDAQPSEGASSKPTPTVTASTVATRGDDGTDGGAGRDGGDTGGDTSGEGSCNGVDVASIPVYPNWPQTDWAGNPSHAVGGDLMNHNNVIYEAKWWTSTEPGTSADWTVSCTL